MSFDLKLNIWKRSGSRNKQAKSITGAEAQDIVRMIYEGVLRRPPDEVGMGYYVQEFERGRSIASVMQDFLDSDEFKAKNSSVSLFVPPGHFYSPIVEPREADAHLSKLVPVAEADHIEGIAIDRAAMVDLWNDLLPFMLSSPFKDELAGENRYAFDNSAYAWGDGSVLHGMLRYFSPKRVIEIGSGWSSACMLDTVDKYLDGNCEIQFIEPYPQLLRTIVGPTQSNVRIYENFVQSVPVDIYDALEPNDILLIDSTHIVKTGSDCCFEMFNILPRLKPGVIVHIHDMFWPFEYPRHWVVDENRSWNEIYAIRALLTDNPNWKIIMFNDYMERFESDLVKKTYPTFLKAAGAALWLQRL